MTSTGSGIPSSALIIWTHDLQLLHEKHFLTIQEECQSVRDVGSEIGDMRHSKGVSVTHPTFHTSWFALLTIGMLEYWDYGNWEPACGTKRSAASRIIVGPTFNYQFPWHFSWTKTPRQLPGRSSFSGVSGRINRGDLAPSPSGTRGGSDRKGKPIRRRMRSGLPWAPTPARWERRPPTGQRALPATPGSAP